MTDLLLEWMSFRGAGRTDDVPSDLTAGSSPHRVVGDLAMLGHLEPLGTTSWRIAPPVLAGLPSQDGGSSRAVLCGARTSGVLASLTAACQTASVEMTVTPIPGRPTSLRVTAPSKAALASVAAAARLAFQHDAAFTLLACTPLIRNWPRTPCAMVRAGLKQSGDFRARRSAGSIQLWRKRRPPRPASSGSSGTGTGSAS